MVVKSVGSKTAELQGDGFYGRICWSKTLENFWRGQNLINDQITITF